MELEKGSEGLLTLYLEDLSARFPRGARGEVRRMGFEETRGALRWLAGFHGLFWERPKALERGLWPRGSYWILDQLAAQQLAKVPRGFRNRYLSDEEVEMLLRGAAKWDLRLASRL